MQHELTVHNSVAIMMIKQLCVQIGDHAHTHNPDAQKHVQLHPVVLFLTAGIPQYHGIP